jgi:hypothetical protein
LIPKSSVHADTADPITDLPHTVQKQSTATRRGHNGVCVFLHRSSHRLRKTSYTHYYEIPDWESPEWKAAWPQLVKDAQTIIDAAGVTVSGPTEDEDVITPPLANEKDGIYINDIGEDPYESFILVPYYQDRVKNRLQFCKTARREYDDVVTCILLRAKLLAPKSFKLSSVVFLFSH